MQRTNIYLDERQCDALDQWADGAGISRAELIRRIIDRALAGTDADLERDLEAIRASFGVLHEADVPDREPDERSQHLERVWRISR
jgi:hypothetical protein